MSKSGVLHGGGKPSSGLARGKPELATHCVVNSETVSKIYWEMADCDAVLLIFESVNRDLDRGD
jgi:hypothetical protein